MKPLILLLLSPSLILAQSYHPTDSSSSPNPNDEPFLPIYPIYPYNPKLIKRGTERDINSPHLTPELYAPKIDARDTYTTAYNVNYQRDPYYPTYNPYPKTQSVTSYPTSTTSLPNNAYTSSVYNSPTNSYVNPIATGYPSQSSSAYSTPNNYSPYVANGYSTPYTYTPQPYSIYNTYPTSYANAPNPYPANPYAAGSYPNYNYQAPYYYPNYYNQPYPPPGPPPPPHSPSDYQENSNPDEDDTNDEETPAKSAPKKSESRKNRFKEDDSQDSVQDSKDGQFVDGGNYLSSGGKDLDVQSSTYKNPNAYNNLEEHGDQRLRSASLAGVPRTTYRVISVGGQPVGPDYPLPTTYAKVQQLEQLMSRTLAKLLAQNAAQQNGQLIYRGNHQVDEGSFPGTNKPRNVIAKTGLGYVTSQTNSGKSATGGGQFFGNFGDRQTPLVIKVGNPGQVLQQGSTTVLAKAGGGKYGVVNNYGRKPVTGLEQTSGVYIPPEAKNLKDDNVGQSGEYGDYDSSSSQNYDGPGNGAGYGKNEQNYSIDPYHSSNLVTVQTPQAQSFQYSSYMPTQSSQQQQQQQQQAREYKTNLDNVGFGNKRTSKE